MIKAIFLLLISVQVRAGITSQCQLVGFGYKTIYPGSEKYEYSLRAEFKKLELGKGNGGALGAGGFGDVRKLPYKINGIPEIACKLFRFKSQSEVPLADFEVDTLVMLNSVKPAIAPRILGCQYDPVLNSQKQIISISELYVAQELEGKSLSAAAETIRNWPAVDQVRMHVAILRKLAKLWSLGIKHADIKSDNIMLTVDGKDVVLIDFNLAQKTTDRRSTRGTPAFMPPSILPATGTVSEVDDLYSWAMTFFDIQAPNQIWSALSSVKKSCYQIASSEECQRQISEIVIKTLSNSPRAADWGTYLTKKDNPTDSCTNVMTVVANIAYFYETTEGFNKIADILQGIADDMAAGRKRVCKPGFNVNQQIGWNDLPNEYDRLKKNQQPQVNQGPNFFLQPQVVQNQPFYQQQPINQPYYGIAAQPKPTSMVQFNNRPYLGGGGNAQQNNRYNLKDWLII